MFSLIIDGTKHMKMLQQPMKSNKRNSKKNKMAPPAPPNKRELPSVQGGKGVGLSQVSVNLLYIFPQYCEKWRNAAR